jgi:N-acetylglutamate synthase-like GNAT family acetyltransferase
MENASAAAHGPPLGDSEHPATLSQGVSVSTETIRIATTDDLTYINSLMRKHAGAVGFMPFAGLEWLIQRQLIKIALENGEPAGYLLGRKQYRWAPLMRPITQAAIQYDAQRRHLGSALVKLIEADARAAGQIALQCCCAADLDANQFWSAEGFKPICWLTPDNARKRPVICWRKPLASRLPLWFAQPPPRSGHQGLTTKAPRSIRQFFESARNKVHGFHTAKRPAEGQAGSEDQA